MSSLTIYDRIIQHLNEHIFLSEQTEKVLSSIDTSFGVISTKTETASKTLKTQLIKMGHEFIIIDGFYTVAPKNKKDEPEEIPDIAFIVMPNQKQSDEAFIKHISIMAQKVNQPAFLFKGAEEPVMYAIGLDENKWPGKGVKKVFGKYTPSSFVGLFERFKGKSYTFERLHKYHAEKKKNKK